MEPTENQPVNLQLPADLPTGPNTNPEFLTPSTNQRTSTQPNLSNPRRPSHRWIWVVIAIAVLFGLLVLVYLGNVKGVIDLPFLPSPTNQNTNTAAVVNVNSQPTNNNANTNLNVNLYTNGQPINTNSSNVNTNTPITDDTDALFAVNDIHPYDPVRWSSGICARDNKVKGDINYFYDAVLFYAKDNKVDFPPNTISGKPDILPTSEIKKYLEGTLTQDQINSHKSPSANQYMYLVSEDRKKFIVYGRLEDTGYYNWQMYPSKTGSGQVEPNITWLKSNQSVSAKQTGICYQDDMVKSYVASYQVALQMYGASNKNKYPPNKISGTADYLYTSVTEKYLKDSLNPIPPLNYCKYLVSSDAKKFVVYGWQNDTGKYLVMDHTGSTWYTPEEPTINTVNKLNINRSGQ